MTRSDQVSLLLTQHALNELAEIYEYSKAKWGIEVADRYLDELNAGLVRIEQQPNLLRPLPDLPPSLVFYRVSRHFFVCDLQKHSVVVLTVIHGSMDIPNRLADLLPTLREEVELLHKQLENSIHSSSRPHRKKRKSNLNGGKDDV